MNTLDEDKLLFLKEAVNQAQKFGFSSLSSPIDLLLEAEVDLLLLISKAFKEGAFDRKSNPSIKFLDDEGPDPLGNSKQVKLWKKRKLFFDPKVSQFLRNLTTFFILLKKSIPQATDFMSELMRKEFKPPKIQEQNKVLKKEMKRSLERKNAAYYRRLRKNRSKIK